MNNKRNISLIIAFTVLVAAGIVSIAWQKDPPKQRETYDGKDTTKVRKKSLTDADMKKIDDAMADLDVEMKNLDLKLEKIDFEAINKEVKDALASVDFNAINKQVEESVKIATDQIKKIDWNEIKKNIDQAMVEANKEISKIDFNKINAEIKTEMEKVKKEQLDVKIDMSKINKEINEAMANARVEIAKAKEQLKEYKAFTDELQKDGLIDKEKEYRIEWKGDDLYINGKMQSKEVSNKYHKYKKLENINSSYNEDTDNDNNDKDTDSL